MLCTSAETTALFHIEALNYDTMFPTFRKTFLCPVVNVQATLFLGAYQTKWCHNPKVQNPNLHHLVPQWQINFLYSWDKHFYFWNLNIKFISQKSTKLFEEHQWYYRYMIITRRYLVCGYSDRLRARRSGDRIPVGTRFSWHIQTGLEGHPAIYIGFLSRI